MKSLHRKRTEKIRENTLDKKQIYRFFFREIIASETLKQKGTEKFAMNTILEDLNHICLRVGGSSFEMKLNTSAVLPVPEIK